MHHACIINCMRTLNGKYEIAWLSFPFLSWFCTTMPWREMPIQRYMCENATKQSEKDQQASKELVINRVVFKSIIALEVKWCSRLRKGVQRVSYWIQELRLGITWVLYSCTYNFFYSDRWKLFKDVGKNFNQTSLTLVRCLLGLFISISIYY